MAFSFGSGFGQSQAASSPFGSTPAAPFGQAAGGFGQPTSPFGSATSTPAFGAASTPAFGAASTPAFGSAATPAFGGGNAFGAKPAAGFGGFGAASTPSLFGAASQPAFGATSAFGGSSSPAFGAPSTPAFGASSPFGSSTPAFGAAASTPAFGAASTPAFGATSSPLFGAASSPAGAFGSAPSFGSPGGFGAGAFGAAATGTRAVPYTKTVDQDQSSTSSTGQKQTVHLNSISAMKQYEGKSPEELHWEDYQAGVKGGTGQPPAAGVFGQQPASTGFGAAAGSPFGSPASSSAAFGGGAFGMSQPAFGAQQSAPAFGSSAFGSTAPAFGAAQPAFGAASTSGGLFGSTTSSPFGGFGGGFGASQPAAFGAQASTPAFGSAAASTPAFGGTNAFGSTFGASSTPAAGGFGLAAPAFGASSASTLFGSTTPASPFGGGATPGFGATSAPAFSFAQSTPAFSGAGSTPFGASKTAFGGASTPAFGSTGGMFGQAAPKSGGLFAPSSTSFGTPGAFGAAQSSAFAAPTTNLFGSGAGNLFSSPGTSAFQLTAAQPQQAAPGPVPGVATTPYGTLPAPPQVGYSEALPEHRVGLTQRPLGPMVGRAVMRPTALLTPRSITPRAGVRLRTPRLGSANRAPSTGGERAESTHSGAADGTGQDSQPDPRRLFVRDPLPSTASASTSTAAPATGRPSHDDDDARDQPAGGQQDSEPEIQASDSGRGQQQQQQQQQPQRQKSQPDRQQREEGDGDEEERTEQPADRNGAASGRARSGNLQDHEISEMLPQLQPGSDYHVQPSLTQLAAMAREDPESLAHVANFTVGRPGIGSVHWLEEVDVRGVDVEGLVRLTKGGVEVYLDDADKPPVGEGLNCAARITLLSVYKMDEATKKPTTDAAAIERFTVKLKKLAARQGATFVSYKPERGEWRFDVEHFSRYGLVDADTDDEEPQADKRNSAEDKLTEDEGSIAMLEGDDSAGFEIIDGDDLDGMAEAEGAPAEQQPGRRAATDQPLAVSLPTSLGLDPARLSAMRSSLFQSSRPLQRRRGGEQGFDEAAGAPAPVPAAAAPNSWRDTAPALQAPRHAVAQGSPLPRMLTPALALPPPNSQPATAGLRHGSTGVDNMVDAGLMLGQTSRVGWGPSGVFAHIVGGGAQRIVLRRLDVTARLRDQGSLAGVAAPADRARSLWRSMLEEHAARSSPDPTPPLQDGTDAAAWGDSLPRWSLKCSREQQLQQLCLSFTLQCTEVLKQDHLQHGLERTCLQHEAWTWDLVHVLFESLAGEQDGEAPGSSLEHEQSVGDPAAPSSLAAFQRRAGLSHWLQDMAKLDVAKQLQTGASGCPAVMSALSGHQLAQATALAAASGDVRLATLLAQAGKRRTGTTDLEAQLHTWEDADMLPHIDPVRLQIFKMLGGQLHAVLPALQLPWRLAAGSHLWYGQGGSTPIQTALEKFSGAVRRGTAPAPMPLHAARHRNGSRQAAAVDTNLQLLRLYAGLNAPDGEADLAALLDPAGYSREPMDARLAWTLFSVLRAIAVLPPGTDQRPQVSMVAMAMIAQLEAIGGLNEWAVYVALHLPDAVQRTRTVEQLLARHAPVWAADTSKYTFLVEQLQIPAASLSAAASLWARDRGNTAEQLASLALAGPASLAQARTLAADTVAPQLLLASRLGDLRAVLAHLRASDAHTAGPLAPYAAYLHLLDANDSGSASEVQALAQQLGVVLQGCSALDHSSSTKAALALIAAACTTAGKQADMDSGGTSTGWQALPLKQADVLEEMQLASAALAEVVAVA